MNGNRAGRLYRQAVDRARRHTRAAFAAAAVLAATITLAGCSGSSTEPGPGGGGANAYKAGAPEPPDIAGKYGSKITDSTISDPKSLNLVVSQETSTSDAVNPLFDGLNTRNAWTLKFEPRLADLPTISADGLTYTYKLKDGLKWSDGAPLTADDVIFTLNVYFDPKIDTAAREVMEIPVDQPDGTSKLVPFKYSKIDDRTVQFVLPTKWAPADETFSFSIMPKHKLESAYSAGTFNSTWGVNTNPADIVSCGGWIIKEYAPRQRIVYARNPYYWAKAADGKPLPYLDTWTTLIVPDLNTTTLKFRSGDTDMMAVPANSYPDIKKGEASGNYMVHDVGPGWGFNYIGFNLNPTSACDKNLVKLFQDVRFRQGVAYAVNRDRMCSDVFRGLAQPLYGPETPANTLFYNPNVAKYPYNLDKARDLFAQCGLKDNGSGSLQYNGQPVHINILTNAENEQRKAIATIITEDLRKLKLDVQFTPVAFNDLIRRVSAPPYDWEAVVMGFTGGPEPNNGANIWRSSGATHQWWPKEPHPETPWEADIDKLFSQGAHELDQAKRKAIYDKYQEIAAEQLPFIFTVVVDANYAIRNHYGNLKPTALGTGIRWDIEHVFDTGATRMTP